MSEFISQYDIQVEIMGKCISACTLVLLSSDRRYVHPRAWIGFHASYMTLEDNNHSYDRPSLRFYDELLMRRLEEINATAGFRAKTKIQDAKGGFFPSYDLLTIEGIINQGSRRYLDESKAPSYL